MISNFSFERSCLRVLIVVVVGNLLMAARKDFGAVCGVLRRQRRRRLMPLLLAQLLLFAHSHTGADAPTHTKILTHSHTQARTLYCFNAQLRRFSFCNFIFQYFLFCFICAQLLGTCFFSFLKWKTFVAPLTSFHTDVNCGSGCDSDCDGNGDNDHDTFFFKLLQYFLLFVCLCFCCSNWDWGLQHAAGFQLGLAAQRAQWSFVTVIAVHFLVVPCGTLDHCTCVFVCVFKFGYCFNLAFCFPPITTKTLHYMAQQQQQ